MTDDEKARKITNKYSRTFDMEAECYIRQDIIDALRDERERCAKVAETHVVSKSSFTYTSESIAAAIREQDK